MTERGIRETPRVRRIWDVGTMCKDGKGFWELRVDHWPVDHQQGTHDLSPIYGCQDVGSAKLSPSPPASSKEHSSGELLSYTNCETADLCVFSCQMCGDLIWQQEEMSTPSVSNYKVNILCFFSFCYSVVVIIVPFSVHCYWNVNCKLFPLPPGSSWWGDELIFYFSFSHFYLSFY